jgi:Glycosyl transferase family 2
MTTRANQIASASPSILEEEAVKFRRIDVAIVLPALNEEEGLVHTLDDIPFSALRRSGWNVLPLVVDGGSTDKTCEIARERGVAVLHQKSRGKGAAVRETLDFLAKQEVRFAVFLDADFTYPGGAIPATVELLASGSQLTIGVREPVRAANDDAREFVHRVGNRLLNITASQLSGLPLLDLCSGFWAVDVRAVQPLHLETDGFEIEAELFTKACRAGYTLSQIPIPYRERIGVAKLHAVRDGIRILLATIRHGRRRLTTGFPMPTPNRLRDLLTVAMMYQHTDYVLVADPSRRVEAQEVARSIGASRPDKSVWLDVSSSIRSDRAAPNGGRRAVTIHLPAFAIEGAPTSPFALVHLPRSDRLIGIAPGELTSMGAERLARSGGFTIGPAGLSVEYARAGTSRVDRVRAIVANTFPSPTAKEIAYLGANGHFGSIAVWRTPGPIGDPAASFPDLRDPLAADPTEARSPAPAAGGEMARIDTASAVLADESLP